MNRLAAITLLFWSTLASSTAAESLSFLRVRLASDGVAVLQHTVRPGRFKTDPSPGQVEIQISDPSGQLLYSGRAPWEDRLEYPMDDGKIGTVARDVSEWSIRVPHFKSASTLRILRPRPSSFSLQPRDSHPLDFRAPIPPPDNTLAARSLHPTGVRAFNLLTNGPYANRLNIVIFGDGFRAGEEVSFTDRAALLLQRFLNTPPYSAYRNFFNGLAIFTPSAESGADRPSQNIFRDTYFSSTFESYGIDRLLTIPPNDRNPKFSDGRGRVFSLLETFVPEYDIAVMLVNDTTYGGSGGVPAVASLHHNSAEIALHEIGHSFAGLGDEYESAANYPDIEEANTTRETLRDKIKWNAWILPSTPVPTPKIFSFASVVGLFEGAHYNPVGWFRPKLDCMMRNLGAPFCEVCREALILASHARIRMIESTFPDAPLVQSDAGSPAQFSFTALAPADGQAQFDWLMDGIKFSPSANEHLNLGMVYLSEGLHRLTLQAENRTAMVRNDPLDRLHESRSWELVVVSSPTPQLQGFSSLSPDGLVHLQFSSSMVAHLILESSSNFLIWKAELTNFSSTNIFFQVTQENASARFFRASARPAF